jgi:hypothetical protein
VTAGVDDDPRVALGMTWVIFDAGGDLSDLDGAALASMAHEMALRDALTIVFDHESEVGSGEEFAVTREGDDVVATDDLDDDVQTGVDFTLHLAPERLSADSTYEEMRPLGSRQRLDVRIAAAAFDDADPVVAGELTLTFAAVAGRDPENAREGTIAGSFRAPLVGEAIAEKNTALLAGALDDRGDGVLALPLAPRSAP